MSAWRVTLALGFMVLASLATAQQDTEGWMNRLLAPGPLIEGHKDLETGRCLECHVAAKGVPDRNCLECHKEIRPAVESRTGFHGTTGKRCVECHADHRGRDFDTSAVKESEFNHAKTGFKLEAGHADLKCADCHRDKDTYLGLKAECRSCHRDDDPHRFPGKFAPGRKDCASCHVASSWLDGAETFDHRAETGYALTGKHQALRCKDCHEGGQYAFAKLESQGCVACHESPHSKSFSKELQSKRCDECHSTSGWKRIGAKDFDHSRDTDFALTGKHQKRECVDCHLRKGKEVFAFKGKEKGFCVSCHESPHEGQFSRKFLERACTDCHSTDSFAKVFTFDSKRPALRRGPSQAEPGFNHSDTRYPLKGAHAELKCQECHTRAPGTEKTKFLFPELGQKECATCHRDPHAGRFGASACVQCHGEEKWIQVREFHKGFTLKGAHLNLACAECHQNTGWGERRLGGLGETCRTCHQKDDIHAGTLPNCAACHQQRFWEEPSFQHSMTRFPLQGAHRTLDCVDCHKGTVYRGTQNRCVDCHGSLAAQVPFPVHVMPQFQNCRDCHNSFSFQ